MARLHLKSLPPGISRNSLFKLLIEEADLSAKDIGAMDLVRRQATIQLDEEKASRALRTLKQNESQIDAFVEPDKVEWPALFQRFHAWIELESKEESQRASRRGSRGLKKLKLVEQWSALAGRVIARFQLKTEGASLPPHSFRSGGPVLVQDIEENRFRGLIARVRDTSIEVVTDEFFENDDDGFSLLPNTEEISRRRMLDGLTRAASDPSGRLAELREVLLGKQEPIFTTDQSDLPDLPEKPRALNDSQWEAVQNALRARDFAVIHGPPGTGKTVTLAELIKLSVERGQKVLACAPSNLAVDNLLLRLLALGVKAIRLGHPARVSEQLQDATIDYLAKNHPDAKLADKLIRQAQAKLRSASRYTRARPAPGERQAIRQEARGLFEDAQRIQRQTQEQILNSADVFCTTLTGIDDNLLGNRRFGLLVIDEACQAPEPACWIPLARAEKLVLAGDHCQLPPTILSRQASEEGYSQSIQERVLATFPGAGRMLQQQYRMHQQIMGFSGGEFYEDQLLADPSVAEHDLSPFIREDGYFDPKPWQFFDTAGADFAESEDDVTGSRQNNAEADFVIRQITQLLDAGVQPTQISVISPYAAQVRKLRTAVAEGVEVDTIDGFQGRENEVVVISLVRSNQTGQIGFLADTRRMNVALTRARRKLIVVGDSSTIGANLFYSRFLQYCEEVDGYHTVWEQWD